MFSKKNSCDKKIAKGFTLVEIIVVLVILAILAAATIPSLLGFIDDAKFKTIDNEARVVRNAAQAYATEQSAKGETDTDIETHEIRVEEVKGEYFGEVDLFFGYWGLLSQNPEYSNYRITYELVPDENSKYGIRVSSISIQRIANEQTSDQDTEPTPFYGIWCTASKDSDEAMESANQLIEKGFDGKVYYTLHWGNLNNEPYYVVTAGTYLNEEEAKANLAEVQSKGYPKAYVKYSGEYLMN